jgi:hypothetical protein
MTTLLEERADAASTPRATRAYAFFLHYNKPASLTARKTKWSVHYRGVCHIVDDIVCYVPTATRRRKRQPRGVVVGRAKTVVVKAGVATIS